MMMRLPRDGRAGRGPADQDVDGAPPSSYQVTWGLDRRRWVAGRPGRGQDRDQGRPPGPPVKFRVTRPRRTGTYILHVQICCKGAPRRDRPREEARNINVSLPTFRPDPGLCNRFGQPAPPRAPGGSTRAPARTAAAAITPTAGRARGNAARPRARHLTREHIPLADVLAGYPAISRTAAPARPARAARTLSRPRPTGPAVDALGDDVEPLSRPRPTGPAPPR